MRNLTSWRVLDKTVSNPGYDGRRCHGLGSIPEFEAGCRFRLDVEQGQGKAGQLASTKAFLRWGGTRLELNVACPGGTAHRDASTLVSMICRGLAGSTGREATIMAILQASHEVELGTWAQARAPRSREYDVDVLDVLDADPETRPALLAAVEAALIQTRGNLAAPTNVGG